MADSAREHLHVTRRRTLRAEITASIEEMDSIFGIETTRMSLSNEFSSTIPNVLSENVSLFADEMCITGVPTSLQLSGLTARNPNNVFLQMALKNPAKSIKRASARGTINKIHSVTSALCMGVIPTMGTTCHEIIVDNEFIMANRKTTGDTLRELEKAMQ